MRRYVIGDIHGCYFTLLDLINKLSIEKGDKLIFLGDYIDRGPHSKRVIDYIMSIEGPDVITLMGNHERMCVDANRGSGYWGQTWMNNGGGITVDSYDERTEEEKVRPSLLYPELQDEWRAKLPRVSEEHIQWMESLPVFYEDDDFFYCHAGIDPDYSFDDQIEDDLLWIRNRFLKSENVWPKKIVFGHTPMQKVQIKENKIGVDTGACYGNMLSAICLDTMTVYSVPHNDKDEPIWG